MFFRKILCLTLVILLCLNFSVCADVVEGENTDIVTEYYSADIYEDVVDVSADVSDSLDINAQGVVLMETSTGEIIYKKNENKRLSPASITKIMTMLLVVEAIENKQLKLQDKIKTTEHAASMGGSQIWLEVGEEMSAHDLLKSVAVGSANDAAVSLAEHIAGSEEAFVAKMNERAKSLGMKNTNFTNACGLDDDSLYTTAKDVAIMSAELIKHEFIKQYTTIWMDSVRNESVQLVNTNKLVRFYQNCTGLKTGTTSKAGYCLSATAKRDGMELVAVVMGADNSNDRFASAKKLLNYGFANYKLLNLEKEAKIKNFVKIANGKQNTLRIGSNTQRYKLIKNFNTNNLKVEIKYNDDLSAPIYKNDVVGKVIIKLNDSQIIENKIVSLENVERIDYSFCFARLLETCFKL